MSVSVTWNHGDMMKAARRGIVDGLTAVQVEFQKDIGKMLNRHASNRSRGGTPSPVGSPPGKATGTLARSWQTPARNGFAVVDVSGLSDPLRPRINHGSNLAYARIHEYGGPIPGKPWLTIPVHPDAKSASAQGVRALAFGNTFIRPIKNGKLGIFRSRKRSEPELLYILQKSVRMPARPYVLPASRETQGKAARIAGGFLNRALKGFTK